MTTAEDNRFGSASLASKTTRPIHLAALVLIAAIAGPPGCTKQEDVRANETMNDVHDVAAEAKSNIREEAADAKDKIQKESREAREEIKDATADEG